MKRLSIDLVVLRWRAPVTAVSFIFLLLLPAVPTLQADILVTHKGSRWEGTVSEKEDFYLVVTETGSKLKFPKEIVKEVIRQYPVPDAPRDETEGSPADGVNPQKLRDVIEGLQALVSEDEPPPISDAAKKAFDELFGPKVATARKSGSRSEKVTLARDLIEAAEAAGNQPDFLYLLLCTAWDLSHRNPSGHDTASQAMKVLWTRAPEYEDAAKKRGLLTMALRFASAAPDQKRRMGRTLVEKLMASAGEKARVGDFVEARAFSKAALDVAEAVEAPYRQDVLTSLRRLDQKEQTAEKLPKVNARLKQEPTNEETWHKLVRLCVVQMDSPHYS